LVLGIVASSGPTYLESFQHQKNASHRRSCWNSNPCHPSWNKIAFKERPLHQGMIH